MTNGKDVPEIDSRPDSPASTSQDETPTANTKLDNRRPPLGPNARSRESLGGSVSRRTYNSQGGPVPAFRHRVVSTGSVEPSARATVIGGPLGAQPAKMTSLPAILRNERNPSQPTLPKTVLSAPDITKVDFVVAGPGIGTSRTSSTSVEKSRRSSKDSTGTPGRNSNASRRPVFQGKAALVASLQKRMSAVDLNLLLEGGSDSDQSRKPSLVSGLDDDAVMAARQSSVERPSIVLYPRREVHLGSAESIRASRSSSVHITPHTTGRGSQQRSMRSQPASNRQSVTQQGRPLQSQSAGQLPEGAWEGLFVQKEREGRASKDVSAVSLAGQRQGSKRLSASPLGSPPDAPSQTALTTDGVEGKHGLPSPLPSSEAVVPSDMNNQSDVTQTSLSLPPRESSVQPLSPSSIAFESRPMSVVGDLDDGYRNNPDYYEYLMLCQRHASSNFIHKVDSSEVVWMSDASHVKMIGRYLLGDQIGKGAFGKVKEGLCAETLQRVAVKIVNKKRLRKMQGGVEGVVREMKLLRRLKHRNIITLVDVYCKVEDDEGNVGVFNWFSTIEDEPITWRYEDGTERDRHVDILKWYLVFEYCPCSLQVLLEQAEGGKLPIPRAHHFFVQLMEGINFLHLQGVIHRDIKPGNMLITPDNHLKISDFGIAEQFSGYTNTPMIITSFAGTHQFLAPEIAEGLSQFSGEKADVWACGITLFNMVTGRYPFEFDEDGNLLALYEKIMGAGFATPPEVSPDLKNLFDGMLEKDPDKRLSTAQVLTHPWTLTFFEESLRAPPPIYSYPARSSELNPTDPSISTGASLGTPAAATVGRSPAAATPKSDMRGVNDIPSDKEHAAAHSSDQPKHSGVSSAKRPQHVTPCETTLIPYLEQLFADEIEEELEKLGRIDDHLDDSRQVEAATNRRQTRRIKNWLKQMFGKKYASKEKRRDEKGSKAYSTVLESRPLAGEEQHVT